MNASDKPCGPFQIGQLVHVKSFLSASVARHLFYFSFATLIQTCQSSKGPRTIWFKFNISKLLESTLKIENVQSFGQSFRKNEQSLIAGRSEVGNNVRIVCNDGNLRAKWRAEFGFIANFVAA